MNRRFHTTRLLAGCLMASLGPGVFADTITLKTAARQRPGSATVVLGDIAALQGEEALRLADVPLATFNGAQPLEITVSDVRRALDVTLANWARIDLSGGTVIVRPARHATDPPPAAMTAMALEGDHARNPAEVVADSRTFTLDAARGEASVRGMIADLIITSLQIEPCDMRVRCAAEDDALLGSSTSLTRFEVQPLGSLAGDRLAFAVRAWHGTAAESRGQITLTAQRRVEIARAARDIARNSAVAEADVVRSAEWLSASEASQAAAARDVPGKTVSRSVNAGDLLRRRDLAQAAVVRRGDLVTVRCLVGGVALSLQAEARADGALGEAIEFRKSGERETFLATITAANEAVVNLANK